MALSNQDPAQELTQEINGYRLFDLTIRAASRLGISGTIIISVIVAFFWFGTIEQKRFFIDQYILLKFIKEDRAWAVFILICLLIAFIFTHKHYRDQLKIKDQKIDDVNKQLEALKLEYKALKKKRDKDH
jgi:Na+/alanine symporter